MPAGTELIIQQRHNVKFCILLGKSATETFSLLQQAYVNECMGWSPLDFAIFPQLKAKLEGIRFETTEELQKVVQQMLLHMAKDGFANVFEDWIARHKKLN